MVAVNAAISSASSASFLARRKYPTERLDLDRLQHQDDEARPAQVLYHTAFVTAGRLDADPRDACLG